LDKKREEELEKIEFELEKEYEEEKLATQEVEDVIFETENKVENTAQDNDEIPSAPILAKKKKREMLFELALFFILGFLIGITIKTEAVKKITIGFNDYLLPAKVERYDVDAMKNNLLQQAAAEQAAVNEQQARSNNQ